MMQRSLPHSFPDIYEKAGGKRRLIFVAGKTDKILQVRILLDLQHGPLITQVQLMLDDHRTDYQPGILARPTFSGVHSAVVS